MPHPEASQSTPVWKLALIPVLLIGLIWNLTRSHDDGDVPPLAAQTSSEQPSNESGDSPSEVSVEVVLQQLRETRNAETFRVAMTLEDMEQHDPFSSGGELAQLTGESSSSDSAVGSFGNGNDSGLEATRTLTAPVQAVMHGPRGAVALVDSRFVRVGDFLEPDVRVVAIESNAIVVELARNTDLADSADAGPIQLD